jgi:hypothetical protein
MKNNLHPSTAHFIKSPVYRYSTNQPHKQFDPTRVPVSDIMQSYFAGLLVSSKTVPVPVSEQSLPKSTSNLCYYDVTS